MGTPQAFAPVRKRCFISARARRGVIVLVAMRTQNGPIRLFKQQFTFTWHRPQRENLGFLVERLALR